MVPHVNLAARPQPPRGTTEATTTSRLMTHVDQYKKPPPVPQTVQPSLESVSQTTEPSRGTTTKWKPRLGPVKKLVVRKRY